MAQSPHAAVIGQSGRSPSPSQVGPVGSTALAQSEKILSVILHQAPLTGKTEAACSRHATEKEKKNTGERDESVESLSMTPICHSYI